MKLILIDKTKKDIFVVFFQLLKNFTNAVNILFHEDYMYIQGMDKSHVCLYDIKVFSTWFDNYEILKEDSKTICVSTSTIHSVLSISQDNQSLHIHFQGDPDKINIDFINEKQLKGEFSRFFEIPLIECELELLDIPSVDYDAEF